MDTPETIANRIILLAKAEIAKGAPYQNINSAVHGVIMEVAQFTMAYMNEHKGGDVYGGEKSQISNPSHRV